jgi:hypothetical protein
MRNDRDEIADEIENFDEESVVKPGSPQGEWGSAGEATATDLKEPVGGEVQHGQKLP